MKNQLHVQAHRGAKKEAGENSIPSVQCAAQMGVDSIEIDVQLTRDGHLILVHDFYWKNKFISDMDLKDLTPFPLLESVFKSFNPETLSKIQWLDIEIKRERNNPKSPSIEAIVAPLLRLTKEKWKVDKVAFRSFDWEILEHIRSREPQYRIIPLVEKGTNDFSSALQMKTEWIAPCFSDITQAKVDKAHQEKVKLMPYTVNDRVDWQRLIDWRVDGVTTDDPRALLEFLGRAH